MENVLLVVLLLLALALIAVVLLQRSEGGGLGMGGGGGGVMSARGAATALSKLTWGLGIAFLAVSLAMTVLSARQQAGSSVIDAVADEPAPAEDAAPAVPALPDVTDLMPPSPSDAPVAPPRAD